MPDTSISVIGLGKLGAPLSAVLASKGFHVVGVDCDENRVMAVNAGQAPVQEPGLPELIGAYSSRLSATSDTVEAVRDTSVTFIIVPTPSKEDGAFSSALVLECIRRIAAGLAEKDAYHLVVLTSTVMPGTTDGEVLPLLEELSGKTCGRDFGLCYNPEFIAIGNVISGMLHPDFVLIGECDTHAGEQLESIYVNVCGPGTPVAHMSLLNAEITKISVNAYVTMKISYANMLGEVCEKLPGGDVDAVTDAIGLDSRIGRKFLTCALGYGGPCFPRDTVAFGVMARRAGVQPALTDASDTVNHRRVAGIMERIQTLHRPGDTVGILGLAYRPDTGMTEESQCVEVASALLAAGIDVIAYDPQAIPEAKSKLGATMRFADSARACAEESDVLVIATPWREFERVLDWCTEARPKAILDCWGIVPPRETGNTSSPRVERLGRHSSQPGKDVGR